MSMAFADITNDKQGAVSINSVNRKNTRPSVYGSMEEYMRDVKNSVSEENVDDIGNDNTLEQDERAGLLRVKEEGPVAVTTGPDTDGMKKMIRYQNHLIKKQSGDTMTIVKLLKNANDTVKTTTADLNKCKNDLQILTLRAEKQRLEFQQYNVRQTRLFIILLIILVGMAYMWAKSNKKL